jgi:hypothetical protein
MRVAKLSIAGLWLLAAGMCAILVFGQHASGWICLPWAMFVTACSYMVWQGWKDKLAYRAKPASDKPEGSK